MTEEKKEGRSTGMKCSLNIEPSLALGSTPEEEWPERLETAAAEVLAEFSGGRAPAPAPASIEESCGEIAATVGLAGSAWGALSVCCSPAVARRLACRMLGLPAASQEQISLALGEIACRVARRIRARYIRPAEECLLSPPSIVTANEVEEEWWGKRDSHLGAVGFEGCPVWVRLSLEL
jgi:CheY-specific phosphatase CheX